MTTANLALARQQLANLEADLGSSLHTLPVAVADQWTATLRELASHLDCDLDEPRQANAAFVGAYMLFSHVTRTGPLGAAHMLRALSDRAQADPGPALPVVEPVAWWRRWWRR